MASREPSGETSPPFIYSELCYTLSLKTFLWMVAFSASNVVYVVYIHDLSYKAFVLLWLFAAGIAFLLQWLRKALWRLWCKHRQQQQQHMKKGPR